MVRPTVFFSSENKTMRILLLLLFLFSIPVVAQQDSSLWLRAVDIQSLRFDFSDASMSVHSLDTFALSKLNATTLADRLNRESVLFVKSYGSGSLSTVSIRGTGAAHSAVLWNGISLNSPMLGLYDFSLLPMFLLDDVKVQAGGNGPLVGSGGVGGAIFMDANINFKKRMQVKLFSTFGSFGQMQQGVALEGSTGKVISKTKFYHQRADNDFKFKDYENKEKTQSNAQVKQVGVTQDLSYGTLSNHVDLHAWYLKNEREIPALSLAQSSSQTQDDHSLRIAMNWSVLLKKWFWNVRGGFNQEEIRYIDPAVRLNEYSKAISLQSECELGYMITHQLKVMTQLAWYDGRAKAPSYPREVDQQQISLGAKLIWEGRKWYVNGAIRQGYFDGKAIPFLPALSMRYQFLSSLSARADISKVYRVPTLNDRFWVPGGNKNLKPENGFSSSCGLTWNQNFDKVSVGVSAGIFFAQLNEAIVWLPGANGIYSAQNIHELENKGFEGGVSLKYQTASWSFSGNVNTNIVSSIITASDPSYASAIGKQLIYTPELQHRSQWSITYKKLELRYYHNYTGYRYTTVDHSYFLDPFELAEIHLAWSHQIKSSQFTLSAGIRNLYNENYQTIAWRPMSGRSFHTGLLLTFGK
ncbi:MAG: TonB-dependent receptor [Bacteroidetes bacterium]|nr:TonB-dependent receptor [Bacteroidota bacterium]